MKQIEIKISFNIEEREYNFKVFQEFLEMFKNGKAERDIFSDPKFKISDQKIELTQK